MDLAAGAHPDGFGMVSAARPAWQRVFPKTKLFAGYNLTICRLTERVSRAINGAFMMARRECWSRLRAWHGPRAHVQTTGETPVPPESTVPLSDHPSVFDEAFFMYGDDLDLCIRVARAGYRIVYDGRVQITTSRA